MADCFDEQWRSVVGFPNYEVSDLGRVRRRESGRVLKLILRDGHGKYLVACMSAYPKVHQRPVHQLVMHAFVGSQAKGIEVRHLDGVPTNNRLSNLAYGTKSDNMQDAIRHGTFPLLENRPGAKLTRQQAVAIYLSDEPTVILEARYGIGKGVVRQIKMRETWRSVTEGLPPPVWNVKRKLTAEELALVLDRSLPRADIARRLGLALHQIKGYRRRYGLPPIPFADRLSVEQWAIILDPGISVRIAAGRAGVSLSYVRTQRHAAQLRHAFPMQERAGIKLTRQQAVTIYISTAPATVLAERFGVSVSMIKRIKTRDVWHSATEGLPLPTRKFHRKHDATTIAVACDRSLPRDEVMRRTGLSFHQIEYLRERHAQPPVPFADRLSKEQWAVILDPSIGPTAAARRADVSLSYVKTQRRTAQGRHPLVPEKARIKLTRQEAAVIYTSAEPTDALAERFGVKASVVRRIKARQAWRSATEGLPPPAGESLPSSPAITCDRSLPRVEVMRRTGLSLYQVEYMRQRHGAPPVTLTERLSAEQRAIVLDLSIGSTTAARRAGVSVSYVKRQRRAARDSVDR